jgi:hypothetical protein
MQINAFIDCAFAYRLESSKRRRFTFAEWTREAFAQRESIAQIASTTAKVFSRDRSFRLAICRGRIGRRSPLSARKKSPNTEWKAWDGLGFLPGYFFS